MYSVIISNFCVIIGAFIGGFFLLIGMRKSENSVRIRERNQSIIGFLAFLEGQRTSASRHEVICDPRTFETDWTALRVFLPEKARLVTEHIEVTALETFKGCIATIRDMTPSNATTKDGVKEIITSLDNLISIAETCQRKLPKDSFF